MGTPMPCQTSLKTLSYEVLRKQGSYSRVRIYVSGWHKDLGLLHFGWTGKETIIEKDVITPSGVFYAKESETA